MKEKEGGRRMQSVGERKERREKGRKEGRKTQVKVKLSIADDTILTTEKAKELKNNQTPRLKSDFRNVSEY